jgi:uncharacterized protein YcfJ
MKAKSGLLLLVAAAVLSACATMPPGPSVMVLPAPGKSFETFQADDAVCKQWADQQIGTPASKTVNQNLFSGAAVGTLMGTALGAAIGGASGDAGIGAAIGAASGLIGGTAVAAAPAASTGQEVQRRYDNAYQECMYAKGNQIPGYARQSRHAYRVPPPPPPNYTPGPPAPSSLPAGGNTPLPPP